MTRSLIGSSLVGALTVGGFLCGLPDTDPTSEPDDAKPAARVLLAATEKPVGTVRGKLDVVAVGPTKAIEFSGVDDRLVIAELKPGGPSPADAGLPQRAFSVGGWVNTRKTTRWGAFVGALQDNGNAERGWMLGLENDRFSFGLATEGANDGDGRMTYLQSANRFEIGRWYHVVATYDGETMRLFVNGRADAQSTAQSGDVLYPSKATFVVGAYVDDDENHPFSGWIESLDLAHYARTAEEIAADFTPGRARTEYVHAIDPAEGELEFVVHPFLQFPTQNSIRIVWETDAPANAKVVYGTTIQLDGTATNDEPAHIHDVLIEGLEPRTQYFYRVHSEDEHGRIATSDILTFQTAVHEDDAYAFTVVGDTQFNPEVTGRIATLCYGLRPNFQIHAGDLVSTGGIKQQWVEHFFRPSRELMSRVAVFPVLGNHEQNAHWFYDYFTLPEPEYHYTFTYGNAQFFMLDTNKPVGPDSPQYQWLERELAASTAKWKFTVHHHPIWSSDSNDYGNTATGGSTWGNPAHRPLTTLYEKYGVDVVFNGHVHMYERTWPLTGIKVDQENGVRYVTTGGSGGHLEAFAPNRTWFHARGARMHHFCYVTVHDGTLRFQAIDVEGRLFDVLDLAK